jgi:hypothetical protein
MGGPTSGRRKHVDKAKLRTLALIGASTELMARTLCVSRDTLERRFRAQIDEARSNGDTQILGKIWQAAMRGSRWALELSAINRLGWSNRPEVAVSVVQNAPGPPPLTMSEFKRQVTEGQQMAEAYFHELQAKELTDGDGSREV